METFHFLLGFEHVRRKRLDEFCSDLVTVAVQDYTETIHTLKYRLTKFFFTAWR